MTSDEVLETEVEYKARCRTDTKVSINKNIIRPILTHTV
jgi:hypothetical protein